MNQTLTKILSATLLLFASQQSIKADSGEPLVADKKPATVADSLSYAAGLSCTQGILSYLLRECQVDSAMLPAVIESYKEALSRNNDPEFRARWAGALLANMTTMTLLPQTASPFLKSSTPVSSPMFHEGFLDGMKSDSTVFTEAAAQDYYLTKQKAEQHRLAEEWREGNKRFLEKVAKLPGVKRTASGVLYRELKKGKGPKPAGKDAEVTVRYQGHTIDGTVFDSSYQRNPQTSRFRIGDTVQGWQDAVLLMPEGSKWEIYIPAELAYGDKPAGRIKANSTLVFELELVKAG